MGLPHFVFALGNFVPYAIKSPLLRRRILKKYNQEEVIRMEALTSMVTQASDFCGM